MTDFLAGILFAMAFWAIIASHIGSKITDDPNDKEGISVMKMFFGAYILVLIALIGVMVGALFL